MERIYDIVIIGAGPSGIAAAAYAAKFGAKTALFEKSTIIGGAAFKANVHTLNGGSLSSMDGLLTSITKKAWGSIIFHPEELLDKYYELLNKYKVSIFTGYSAISAKTEDSKITSIVFSSCSGKRTVSAKFIVDATSTQEIEILTGTNDTGIASYAYMSGLIGKVETVGGKCYSQEAKKLLKEKISYLKDTGEFSSELFMQIQPTVRADIAQLVIKHENSEHVTGAFMRKRMTESIKFLQNFGYGFENASLIVSSKEIFYSAQGNSSAKYTLSLDDISQSKYFNDQVASLPDYDGDDDKVYYIPYGSILSAKFENLLLCGRNIGATMNAMDQIDAIPTHFETGKAAGIAGAIAIKNEIELDSVSSYEIISKTQDSVAKKIEILNESVGEEDTTPKITLNIIEGDDSESETIAIGLITGEPEENDSFQELDNALSLIGEDVLSSHNQAEEAQDFMEDMSHVIDIDNESIIKKTVPEEESAESKINKMSGFTNSNKDEPVQIDDVEQDDNISPYLVDYSEKDKTNSVESDYPEPDVKDSLNEEIFETNQPVDQNYIDKDINEGAEKQKEPILSPFIIKDNVESIQPISQDSSAETATAEIPEPEVIEHKVEIANIEDSQETTTKISQEDSYEETAEEILEPESIKPKVQRPKRIVSALFRISEEYDEPEEELIANNTLDEVTIEANPTKEPEEATQQVNQNYTNDEIAEEIQEPEKEEIAQAHTTTIKSIDSIENTSQYDSVEEVSAPKIEEPVETHALKEETVIANAPKEDIESNRQVLQDYFDDDIAETIVNPKVEKPVETSTTAEETAQPIRHKYYNENVSEPEKKEPILKSTPNKERNNEKLLEKELAAPKNIVSNDDVLSLLYEQNENSLENKISKSPSESIVQDELSLLYGNTANKTESPKKELEKKDKTSKMLDMIYEITETNEDKTITDEDNNLPNEWIEKSTKKESNDNPLNDDKFKSIKDFLYDND